MHNRHRPLLRARSKRTRHVSGPTGGPHGHAARPGRPMPCCKPTPGACRRRRGWTLRPLWRGAAQRDAGAEGADIASLERAPWRRADRRHVGWDSAMPSLREHESGEIRYANSGVVSVAYQVNGLGPVDLVYVGGWITHIEAARQD